MSEGSKTNPGPGRRHADDDHGTGAAHQANALFDRFAAPHGNEDIVGPVAVRDVPDTLPEVLLE